MDDHGTLLAVVLDLSPQQWHRAANDPQPLSLDAFLSQLLAFLNAHVACMHENTLAVFGAFPGKSVMLYASTDQLEPSSITVDANSYPPFKLLDTAVVTRIAAELDALDDSHDEEEVPCALVGALTKALCYVNRISATPQPTDGSQGVPPQVDPRILILSVSPDLSASYIPIMNAIFSAQKLKVTIDACQIYGGETVFLQQAAHLSGGSYLLLEHRDALLQYLTMSFLPPPSIRKILAVPTQDRIDFRAACFCHKNIVDIGYVCSVCLSIFCKPSPVCSTCRTKFPIKTLQRLNALRAPSAIDSGRPSPAPSNAPTPTATGINTHERTPSLARRTQSQQSPGAADGFPSGSGAPNRTVSSGGLPHSSAIGVHRNGRPNGS
ncbi:Tfb4-domain-containing protein [Coprinopsis marcescibilis]|uniref:General transcription and DNA repair factor IIH subunit TFB4 n=1 Tax=Coprinopsis marcescibilis TaxID=230819 RepID=A0A5C3L1V1_COPMA|nr:Tfb4-domain-containing protein [Coprinopsis marcescibilis]